MPEREVTDLSLIRDAIKGFWSSTCFTNPLPIWDHYGATPVDIAEQLQQRLVELLDGRQPSEPLEIIVPDQPHGTSTWTVPSVNMQLVLKCCATALEPAFAGAVDMARVFSYRYDESGFAFHDLLRSWLDFRQTVRKNLEGGDYALKLDLKRAFPSIDRTKFLDFISATGQEKAARILKKTLDAWGGQGLPLVNDSVFMLGNAYLSKVDAIVDRHCPRFIRFMDDYWLFCSSAADREDAFGKISRDLQKNTEFKINEEKLKILGPDATCLTTITGDPVPDPDDDPGSLGIFTTSELADSELLLYLATKAVEEPDTCMTIRPGRVFLGTLRRERQGIAAEDAARKPPSRRRGRGRGSRASRRRGATSSRRTFDWFLARNDELRRGLIGSLERYGNAEREEWRIVWILFTLQDLFDQGKANDEERTLVKALHESEGHHAMIGHWANRLLNQPASYAKDLFDLQDQPYTDQGAFRFSEKNP